MAMQAPGALAKAAVLALVLQLAARTSGFVTKESWAQHVYVDGVETCNPTQIAFKERDYKSVRTVVQALAPKKLSTPVLSVGAGPEHRWDSHARPSVITYTGGTIDYLDSCARWGSASESDPALVCQENFTDGQLRAFSLVMEERAAELFYSDYEDGIATCSFDMSEAPSVPHEENDDILTEECYIFRIFQKPFPEESRLMSYDVRKPQSIVASPKGQYLLWTEELNSLHSVIRVFDRQAVGMLPDAALNRGESMAASDIRTTFVTPVRRKNAVYCGEDLILYEARGEANETAVFGRYLSRDGYPVETLATGAVLPIAGKVSNRVETESEGRHICTAAWIHEKSGNVTVMHLPSMESSLLTANDWIDGDFRTLVDLSIAGDFLFAVIRDETTNMHKVRYAQVADAAHFTDVPNSTWPREISLSHRDSESALLYYVRGSRDDGTEDQLRLLRFQTLEVPTKQSPDGIQRVHCVVDAPALREANADTKRILDASIFEDTVVWVADPGTGGNLIIELLDLDKDNDGIFDILDDFPMNHGFTFDDDKDGYADELDFIPYSGMNDDLIMYCLFFTVFAILAVGLLLHARAHKFIRIKRHEVQQLIAEYEAAADTSHATGTRYSTMGRTFRQARAAQSKNGQPSSKSPGGVLGTALSKAKRADSSEDSSAFLFLGQSRSSSGQAEGSPEGAEPNDEKPRVKPAFIERRKTLAFRSSQIKRVARRISALAFAPGGSQKKYAHDGLEARVSHSRESVLHARQAKYDRQLERLRIIESMSETFVTILTINSIGVAIAPLVPYGGVSPQTTRVLIWIDFFGFGVFAIDLIIRGIRRDRKELPTWTAFFRDSWYDVPALLTEVPLTAIWFPDYLRLFKGFRLFRLYRRFTQQAIFISLMVRKPMAYLASFVVAIIFTCTIFIKVFEQNEQEEFRDFSNVLWFALVTVTTVGYGDLKVTQVETQMLLFLLMLIGIGLISTLSAFCAELLVSVGLAEDMKHRMKQDLERQSEMLREGLFHISEPYNPISVALEDLYSAATLKDELRHAGAQQKRITELHPPRPGARVGPAAGVNRARATLDEGGDESGRINAERALEEMRWRVKNFDALGKHRSSVLNVTVGMKAEVQLPIEKFMEGAGGKFRINAISSQADLIRAVAKDHDQRMLLECLRDPNAEPVSEEHGAEGLILTPRTRLRFLLLRFTLHKPERSGVHNFSEMADELADIIFEPPRQRSLPLEKVFAIDEHWSSLCETVEDSERPAFYYYDLCDPLHEKLKRIDEHFSRYGIHSRSDYNELIMELTILIIMHERVRTVRWALRNLEYAPNVSPADPVLEAVEPRNADMPFANVILTGEGAKDEDDGFDDDMETSVASVFGMAGGGIAAGHDGGGPGPRRRSLLGSRWTALSR